MVPGLVLELALELVLEPVPELVLEPVPVLELALEPEPVLEPVLHSQQPPIRSLMLLPLLKLKLIFCSFYPPPKILEPNCVKIFSVENYHPPPRVFGAKAPKF
jgi:hypothetical protein